MPVPNLIDLIHLVVVELFQSGPKWWAHQPTLLHRQCYLCLTFSNFFFSFFFYEINIQAVKNPQN